MAHGCIPVVHASGGPAALVREGACGLLFHNEAELANATELLIAQWETDPERLIVQQTAARTRARDFSRDAFIARMTKIHPLDANVARLL